MDPRHRRGVIAVISAAGVLLAASVSACGPDAPPTQPRFTSATLADFQAGKNGLFAIKVANLSGAVTERGQLPAGLTLRRDKSGAPVISGAPLPGSGGAYHVMLTAAGPGGKRAKQKLAIVVDQAPRLIASATSQWGVASHYMTFKLRATGYPVPRLTLAGKLPPALKFTSRPGAATISGHLDFSWLKAILIAILGSISAVIGFLTGGTSVLFEFGAGAVSGALRSGAEHLLYTSQGVTVIATNGIGNPSTVGLKLHVLGPN